MPANPSSCSGTPGPGKSICSSVWARPVPNRTAAFDISPRPPWVTNSSRRPITKNSPGSSVGMPVWTCSASIYAGGARHHRCRRDRAVGPGYRGRTRCFTGDSAALSWQPRGREINRGAAQVRLDWQAEHRYTATRRRKLPDQAGGRRIPLGRTACTPHVRFAIWVTRRSTTVLASARVVALSRP